MLTDLRENSQHFVIYLLFGILIFVFIFFFGPQTDGCRPGATQARVGWAATVADVDLTQQEVEVAIRRRLTTEDMRDEDLSRLRRETLLQLIDQVAIAEKARAAGFAISRDEIARFLINKEENPEFGLFARRNGKFDYDYFKNRIQSFGTSVETYYEILERELLVRRYIDFLAGQVQVSDAEVRALFDRRERKWNLSFVSFEAPAVEGDDEPKADAATAATFAAANEAALKKFYDDNKARYDRPTEIRIRRIQISPAKDGGDAAKAEARARIEALRTEATAAGADFEALAREKSEGSFKEQGGDMGWQTQENSSAENWGVFSKLAQGQISEIQEAPFGLWFARADEIRAPVKRSFDEVKSEIAALLAAREQRNAEVRTRAQAELLEVRAGKSFLDIMRARMPAPPKPVEGEAAELPPDPSIPETGEFSLDDLVAPDTVPGIGKSARLVSLLPALTEQTPLVDELVEVDDRIYIVRLVKRAEPTDDGFATQRASLAAELRALRALSFIGGWQQRLFGNPSNRAMLSMLPDSGVNALLPDLASDTSIRVNLEAFPASAPPSAAPSAGG
jgi:parvulin-like peptidyl-prolyl isomerase